MVNEPITIWPPTNIDQSAADYLGELIRLAGIEWHRANNPNWREKPYMDGIVVDLDESDVVSALVNRILFSSDPDKTLRTTSEH